MTARRRTPVQKRDEGGRITVVEVIGFTAVLGFVAALASGFFDAMLTWR